MKRPAAKTKSPAVAEARPREFATVSLRRESIRLQFNNRAQLRLHSLENGAPKPDDFKNPAKVYFAACAWCWAMLPPSVASNYPKVDDIADDINPDAATISAIVSAIGDALKESRERTRGEAGKA